MSKSFREDLTGQRFGRLTVLEFVPDKDKRTQWKCKCACGNVCIVLGDNLKRGLTKSCGCFNVEEIIKRNKKHSLTYSRLYNIWNMMKGRCMRPNTLNYKDYGGRGITICDDWKQDFVEFYDWAMKNGYDDTLTLDRIDVNGNYCPENCRWVDWQTQQRNRRNNVVVEFEGKKVTLIEASELSGIKYKILTQRYARGERKERLFRKPRKSPRKAK